jgi:hypothetical protein
MFIGRIEKRASVWSAVVEGHGAQRQGSSTLLLRAECKSVGELVFKRWVVVESGWGFQPSALEPGGRDARSTFASAVEKPAPLTLCDSFPGSSSIACLIIQKEEILLLLV